MYNCYISSKIRQFIINYIGRSIPNDFIFEANVVDGNCKISAAPFLPEIFQRVCLNAFKIFSFSSVAKSIDVSIF